MHLSLLLATTALLSAARAVSVCFGDDSKCNVNGHGSISNMPMAANQCMFTNDFYTYMIDGKPIDNWNVTTTSQGDFTFFASKKAKHASDCGSGKLIEAVACKKNDCCKLKDTFGVGIQFSGIAKYNSLWLVDPSTKFCTSMKK